MRSLFENVVFEANELSNTRIGEEGGDYSFSRRGCEAFRLDAGAGRLINAGRSEANGVENALIISRTLPVADRNADKKKQATHNDGLLYCLI